MKYYLIAGEASGDLHASHLMQQLLCADADAQFRFYGGDKMQSVGGTLVRHYSTLAYMGFVQVVKHLPEILRGMKQCQLDISAFQPDVVILVDYPGFNLKIAKWVKTHLDCKVVYYISPKIWAWKEWRIKDIRRYVDCMLSILPFEVPFYAKHHYDITYVGNPTVDELYPITQQSFERDTFVQQHGLDASRPIVALLAGSRKAEVSGNLPLMMAAVEPFADCQAVIAGAPGLTPAFYESLLKGHEQVKVVFGATYDLLRASRAALVTSGTATLETAYLRVPQVVCYQFKGGMLFYKIMEWALRNIHYVSLVNLLLDAPAVCELLGPYLTTARLSSELQPLLLDSPQRKAMLAEYERMAQILGEPGAPKRAAATIVKLLKKE